MRQRFFLSLSSDLQKQSERSQGGRNSLHIESAVEAGKIASWSERTNTESRHRYSTSSSHHTKPPPLPVNESSTSQQRPPRDDNAPTTSEDLTKRQTNITMASDSDYASFLDKVNQDPSGGVAKSESRGGSKKEGFKATDAGVQIPTVLKRAVVDAFYVSDADEPFEVVGLNYGANKLPDEGMFSSFPLLLPCL